MTSFFFGRAATVGRGRFVASDLGTGLELASTLVMGRVDGTNGLRRISPKANVMYDVPATDGRAVVWAAMSLTGPRPTTRIQTRALSGGRVRTLASYPFGLVWSTAVDGGTAAWIVNVRGKDRLFVHRPDGRTVELRGPKHARATAVAVRGNQVVYVEHEHRTGRLVSYDAGTGQSRVLTSVRGRIDSPVITRSRIVYAADEHRGPRSAIVRINRNGSGRKVLVAERSPKAPVVPSVTASDRWVTYSSWATTYLRQLPIAGGASVRVSCGTGSQLAPAAGNGRRVLWADQTSGRSDLMTRATPRGHCE
jgi:hypothetical protein